MTEEIETLIRRTTINYGEDNRIIATSPSPSSYCFSALSTAVAVDFSRMAVVKDLGFNNSRKRLNNFDQGSGFKGLQQERGKMGELRI